MNWSGFVLWLPLRWHAKCFVSHGGPQMFFRGGSWRIFRSSTHRKTWHHGGMTYCLTQLSLVGMIPGTFHPFSTPLLVACHPASLAAPSTFFKGAIKIHIRISWMHLFSICSLVQPFCGQLVGVDSSRGRPQRALKHALGRDVGLPAQLVPSWCPMVAHPSGSAPSMKMQSA